jgi:RHS repeat-associated protein
MNMQGLNSSASLAKPNAYKFNSGTELTKDFGWQMYDTPFRSYDAQLGRFHQIDPLADLAPGINPYRFGFNNPISLNDPTGLYEGSIIDLVNEVWNRTTGDVGVFKNVGGIFEQDFDAEDEINFIVNWLDEWALDGGGAGQHPGLMDLSKKVPHMFDKVGLHLILGLRWAIMNKEDMDLRKLFINFNSVHVFKSMNIDSSTHINGVAEIKFGESVYSIMYNFPMSFIGLSNEKLDLVFPNPHIKHQVNQFNDVTYSFDFGLGLARQGIRIGIANRDYKILRSILGFVN